MEPGFGLEQDRIEGERLEGEMSDASDSDDVSKAYGSGTLVAALIRPTPIVISSVFTLYCCLSGPKFPPFFPWSSNTMCCNLIIYILSLVHQRRERAKKSNDSPIQVTGTTITTTTTVAETREMTVGVLKKSLVNDDEELSASGGGKQWTLQHLQAPRNSVRHVEEPH